MIPRTLSSKDLQTTLPSSRASWPQLLRYLHMECLSDLLVHIVGECPQESFCRCLIHSLKDKRQRERVRLEQGVRKRACRGRTREPLPTSLGSSGSLAQLRVTLGQGALSTCSRISASWPRKKPPEAQNPHVPPLVPQGMRCSVCLPHLSVSQTDV